MPAVSELVAERAETGAMTPLRGLVLVRVVSDGGVTRAGLIRDLNAFVGHRLSPGEWRQRAEQELTALLAARYCTESRGRFTPIEAGRAAAEDFLGCKLPAKASWPDVRDVQLVARALGVSGDSQANIKSLAKPEGLRALIVQKGFNLPLKGSQSPSRIRADLAVVALERAFGNKIKRGLGAGSGLSSKAGRVLAGQLSRRPQDYGTDGRLVAQLAAELAGAAQSDADALRVALLRSLVSQAAAAPRIEAGRPVVQQPPASPARPANDAGPSLAVAAAKVPPATQRPDVTDFAAEVHAAARTRAEGWPGNRKAFISHVWQVVRQGRPEWALTEIEFKCMLAEAHRAGHVVLASADLKDKKNMKELQESAIGYKNTVWHQVRVED